MIELKFKNASTESPHQKTKVLQWKSNYDILILIKLCKYNLNKINKRVSIMKTIKSVISVFLLMALTLTGMTSCGENESSDGEASGADTSGETNVSQTETSEEQVCSGLSPPSCNVFRAHKRVDTQCLAAKSIHFFLLLALA